MEAAFDDVSLFLFSPRDAEDRVILGCIFRPFGLSLLVLSNYFPQRRSWALMESGPGPQILWPHNIFNRKYRSSFMMQERMSFIKIILDLFLR